MVLHQITKYQKCCIWYDNTFSIIFRHLPSSSIVFHHLPLMEDDPQIKIHRNSTHGYQKRSKDDTRPLSTFSNVHRSSSIVSSIIFHHLPLMEDDPQIKIHWNSTYGYQKRSKDDTRPLSTFSNVHRSSSIVFHHLPKSSIIIHWWKMILKQKFAEIQLMGIKNNPKMTQDLWIHFPMSLGHLT